jgi:anthranilate synthase component 1
MESSDYHGTDNARSVHRHQPVASIAVSHGEVKMAYPDGQSVWNNYPRPDPGTARNARGHRRSL